MIKNFIKRIVKAIITFVFTHFLYRVRYTNLDKLNKFDKCLICPNHSDRFDPFFIYAKTNNLCIMAKAELFENKILASLFKFFDVFPIRRGEHDTRSLLHAIKLFKNVEKRKLLIYIEGERMKKDEARGTAKAGPVFIAAEAGVPIVPVYVTKNPRMFSKIKVNFGDAIYIDKSRIKDKEYVKNESHKLLDTIYDLNPDSLKV